MKKLTFSLLLCAAITFAITSCDLFTSNKHANNSLVGKWKIDSVESKIVQHSDPNFSAINFFNQADSVNNILEFKLDSIALFKYIDSAQNIKYYTDEN